MQEGEAKEKIFQAALAEFAEKGYKAASTNEICKKAGVAKGLLFFYYKNKEGLFDCCIRRSMTEYLAYIKEQKADGVRDVFDRIFFMAKLKLTFYAAHPALSKVYRSMGCYLYGGP